MKSLRDFAVQVISYTNKETIDNVAAMHTVTIGYVIFGATCTYIATQAVQLIGNEFISHASQGITVQAVQMIFDLLF